MKKIYLELDVSGTKGDEAWGKIEQPKGFVRADLQSVPCDHAEKKSHSKGEWCEVSVHVEDACFEDAIEFYKGIDRILAVETDD